MSTAVGMSSSSNGGALQDAARGGGMPLWLYLGGLLAIVVSLTASGGLVWQHLSGNKLPGCGGVKDDSGGARVGGEAAPVSACASLEAHPMGSLGGMQAWYEARQRGETVEKVSPMQAAWPVSFLGAAYFSAALAAWVVVGLSGRRVGWAARAVIWLGALGSVVYIVVIVVEKKYCQYCIASHVGNLTLLAITEVGMMMARNSAARTMNTAKAGLKRFGGFASVAAGLLVFAGTAAAIGHVDAEKRGVLLAKAEAEKTEMLEKIMAQAEAAKQAAEAAKANPPVAAPAKLPWGDKGFVGRWVKGPREAQARIVMVSSYQCPDCRIFENAALALLDKYKDKVSLSVFHFPMGTDCNKHVGSNMHPNGCWAARAAEAAAIISGTKAELEGKDRWEAGNEAFWKMHVWMFGRQGSFTDAELRAALPDLGYPDVDQFLRIMQGEATKKILENDTDIGDALGLFYTPMMFVNGIEVRGWLTNSQALTQAVDTMMAANPPAADHRNDRPDLAREKYVSDWRQNRVVNFPAARPGRTQGPDDAKVDVLVFGDYTEPNTAKLDSAIRAMLGKKSVRYTFRHYPGAKACNPSLPRDFFPNGCLAARAAEAAGATAGPEAFWKMHEFLFTNAKAVSQQRLLLGASVMNLDKARFEGQLEAPLIAEQVTEDVRAGQAAGVRTIPTLYINGKLVDRWQRDGDDVLGRIVEEVLTGKPVP